MEINKTVRKENYERGMKYGEEVYCGQDLRDFIGMTIRDINSDDMDQSVIMWLEDEEKSVAVYFDDSCFDGERIKTVDHSGGSPAVLLRVASERDLRELSEMQGYYDNDVFDEDDKKIGINHMFCNDISLEGTEKFRVKSLYVFSDGRIMTEKEE
ncbi:MAG: hypothetical protein LIP16_10265 [Clostridium sp.]|nr:hypothetical protein [Clostridium sp.]